MLPLGMVLGSALLGCAALPPSRAPRSAPEAVVPVEPGRLAQQSTDAQGCYAAGRLSLDAGHFEVALAYFERAVALRPGWVEAESGRIVALSRLGRTDEAMKVAREAFDARGAVAKVPAAEAPPVAVRSAPPVAPDKAAAAPAASPAVVAGVAGSAAPRLTWVREGPYMYELKWRGVAARVAHEREEPAAASVSAAAPERAARAVVASIEISNGVGRAGLARQAAQALSQAGIATHRLTNNVRYDVKRTEIQYRRAQDHAAAAELARNFTLSMNLVPNPKLRADVDLRVLLGSDALTTALVRPAGMRVASKS
ncbi:MAG: LytR C-terminal domain-containing protein [Burkholderiales bacterium]|nr:LytR C-terminal domain-containing protein [Burkholderiales bacterium]MDE2394797.1 LytR C-terminal domain-containing protein [Burkholderiales bacterium]MDE2452713.1 LytR C-terminal domain-containing protein [Burkholderiales bacterium]